MNKQLLLITFIISLLFLSNCQINNPVSVTDGTVDRGIYSNEFFPLQLHFPEQWTVETLGEAEIVASDDTTQSISENENPKILMANLLTIYKEDPEDSFKPNLAIISEHKSRYPKIKNEEEYLEQVKTQFKDMQASFSDIESTNLSNKIECQTLEYSVNLPGIELQQTHYTMIHKDYFMDIIITYQTEAQQEELSSIVNSLQFKN